VDDGEDEDESDGVGRGGVVFVAGGDEVEEDRREDEGEPLDVFEELAVALADEGLDLAVEPRGAVGEAARDPRSREGVARRERRQGDHCHAAEELEDLEVEVLWQIHEPERPEGAEGGVAHAFLGDGGAGRAALAEAQRVDARPPTAGAHGV